MFKKYLNDYDIINIMEYSAFEVFDEKLELLSESNCLEPTNKEFIDLLSDMILYYWKDGKYHTMQTPQPQAIRSQKVLLRKCIDAMNNHKMGFNKYWIATTQLICACIGEKNEMEQVKDERMKARQKVKEIQAKLDNETGRCGVCGGDDVKFRIQCRDEAYNNLPHGDKEWAEKFEKLQARCKGWQDQVRNLEEQIKSRHETIQQSEDDNVTSLSKTIIDKSECIDKLRLKIKKLEEINQSQKTKHSQEVKELKLSLKSDDKKILEIQKLNEKIIKQDILIKELKKNKPKKKKSKISQEQLLKLLQQLSSDSDSD